MVWAITLVLLLVAVSLLYLWVSRRYSYWSARGVPGPKPTLFVGNMLTRATEDVFELERRWHREFGDLYGVYIGLKPTVTVVDPELIKQIWVRDFHIFMNRGVVNTYHPIFNNVLFAAENQSWRRIRAIVTPNFTTGKLRSLMPLMNECIDKYVGHLDKVITEKKGRIDHVKELMTGFAIDVIATTAFATDTNANAEGEKNPFVYHGIRFLQTNPLRLIAVLGFPQWLNTLLNIKFLFNQSTALFFCDIAQRLVRERKAEGGKNRKDLLQMLLDASVDENDLNEDYDRLEVNMEEDGDEASPKAIDSAKVKSSKQRHLTENEMIAQCIAFFAAGFETTSSTLTYVIHTFAHHPEIQEKLYQELQANVAGRTDVDTKEFYDMIMSLPYLDAVLKETLRFYPAVPRIQRRLANADEYNLAGITLHRDQLIEVSMLALHYNPEYWPEPDVFKPERFLPENRDKIVPYTYLPFGTGPRNCVGMRFALQESKFCIARLVMRYRFKAAPDTPKKMKFRPGSFLLSAHAFPAMVEVR